MRADPVAPPFDDEMKALVVDRMLEALEAKVPPLARGLVGPSEYGLVVGCDEETPTFYARTYFDKTEQPTKLDWSAFAKDGRVVFLDPAGAPDRAAIARAAVEGAVAAAEASDRALATWIAALRDDARWTDTRHAGAAAFGDHAMRTLLADKRTAAASFLRTTRVRLCRRRGEEGRHRAVRRLGRDTVPRRGASAVVGEAARGRARARARRA